MQRVVLVGGPILWRIGSAVETGMGLDQSRTVLGYLPPVKGPGVQLRQSTADVVQKRQAGMGRLGDLTGDIE